jgi:hypothetical protein
LEKEEKMKKIAALLALFAIFFISCDYNVNGKKIGSDNGIYCEVCNIRFTFYSSTDNDTGDRYWDDLTIENLDASPALINIQRFDGSGLIIPYNTYLCPYCSLNYKRDYNSNYGIYIEDGTKIVFIIQRPNPSRPWEWEDCADSDSVLRLKK